MIYTVTFNPALDYIVNLNSFTMGKTNRSFAEEVHFGGKGINVSFVLSQLGVDNVALGFVGGFTGEELVNRIENSGIKSDFIQLKRGITRINIKIKASDETEINADGPVISNDELNNLFLKLEALEKGDVLVLAGSIPKCLPDNIYEKISSSLQSKGIHFVVDATGELLLNVLKYKPFLIKPNIHELEEIIGKPLINDDEIIAAAKELKNKGAVNVLVSLGKEGAILVDEFGVVYRQKALGKKTVNTVGAGDSMVAGFLAGCDKSYEYAIQLGVAAGGATAGSRVLASKEEIFDLLQ